MTSQTINLDLIPKGIPPVIHVSQYDSGQEWTFMLFKDGIAYQIPSNAEVTIQGTKSDNTGFQYSCTYSGSQVVATETKQMTIFAGDVPTELVITKNSEQIGTLNFIIRVEPAALSDDTEISETDLPLLEEAIEAAVQAKGYSEDSEAYAVGTREGVPVGSSDPAYENNAKYYAENFVGMVTDAQYASIQSILT